MHQRVRQLCVCLCLMAAVLSPVGAVEIVVIVNPNNPVSVMTAREVSDLYLGRSRTFAQDDQKIPAAVYEHPQDSALRARFFRLLNGMSLKQLNAYWARLRFSGEVQPPMTLSDGRVVLDAVSRTRDGIGYIDADLVDASVKVVLRLKE